MTVDHEALPGCVSIAVVWILFALALATMPGCGSARQTRLDALTATALVVGTAGDAVELAAEVDARTCTGAPDVTACLVPVRARWQPVDVTLDGLRLVLGAWLVAESVDGSTAFPATLVRILALYRELVSLLAPLGVEVPALSLGGS